MTRPRRDDYVTSERSKAFADLLYSMVVKLDCGSPAHELAKDVENIGRAMGR